MATSTSGMRLNRNFRTLVAFVVAMLALSVGGSTARGAAPDRNAYDTASSYTSNCVEASSRTICTDTALNVFRYEEGTEVCVSINTYAISRQGRYTSISFEWGCVPVAAGAFTIDSKTLSSATLAPATVTLTAYECNRQGCTETGSRDVTVEATFTGTGDVITFSGRQKWDDGTCTYTFSGKGVGRNAVTSLTLDGQLLNGSGWLSSSTSMTKIQCR